jgi:hypothetical protein
MAKEADGEPDRRWRRSGFDVSIGQPRQAVNGFEIVSKPSCGIGLIRSYGDENFMSNENFINVSVEEQCNRETSLRRSMNAQSSQSRHGWSTAGRQAGIDGGELQRRCPRSSPVQAGPGVQVTRRQAQELLT